MVDRKEINFAVLIRTSENVSIKSELTEESSKLKINSKILETQLKNKLTELSKLTFEYESIKTDIELLTKQRHIAETIQIEKERQLKLKLEQLENLQQSAISNREQHCESVTEFINYFDIQVTLNKFMQMLNKRRQSLQEKYLQTNSINVKTLAEEDREVKALLEQTEELKYIYQVTNEDYKISRDRLQMLNAEKANFEAADDIERLQAALKFSEEENTRLEEEYKNYKDIELQKGHARDISFYFPKDEMHLQNNKRNEVLQSSDKEIETIVNVPIKKIKLDCSQISHVPLIALSEEFCLLSQNKSTASGDKNDDANVTTQIVNSQTLQNENDFITARQFKETRNIEKPRTQRSIKQFIFKRPSCQN